jgi:required for meiotic nuclear division protein 1
MYNVIAYQISDNIDIESFQTVYTAELINSNYYELFYEVGTEQYISVFKYGVVCFLNADDTKVDEFTKLISQHCKYFYDSELSKQYKIKPNAKETKFGYSKAELSYCDIESMRLIMLNIAQSVALDYYYQKSRILLEETNKHTALLEKNGKLAISGKELKKFIGKTLNLKNLIVENLHIFDSIPETWQNDNLIKIDIGLKNALYMEKRSDNVHEELKIIREHLEYFSDIMHHSASMKLELIVMILVFIEVFDLIIKRIFQ